MRTAVIALLGIGMIAVACGGTGSKAASVAPTPHESAADAVVRQFTALSRGQYGREWDELHPAQQVVVSRDKFSECASRLSNPQVTSVTPKETYNDPLALASVPEHTSKAVTVEITTESGRTQTQTYHEVAVGGAWKWILGDDEITAFKAGQCPA